MTRPFLLAQLSDPHLGADWLDRDPVPALAAAVEAVEALRPEPDAVLVSGDLAEHGAEAEYAQARELLGRLRGPVYVLAGNHDDRAGVRKHFGLAGAGGEPIRYSVDLGPLRLVVLDTTRPGEDPGALDAERLDWLDAELTAAPAQPTLLAMHHPPLATGVPAWDAVGLPAADRGALGAVLERHPQVRLVAAGHAHRAIAGGLAGRPVLAVPSVYVQARLNIGSGRIELVDEPPAFALHALMDGDLISHLQPVR
jgi:3',5'-cyclic AMP phosphodiesterase CpdA